MFDLVSAPYKTLAWSEYAASKVPLSVLFVSCLSFHLTAYNQVSPCSTDTTDLILYSPYLFSVSIYADLVDNPSMSSGARFIQDAYSPGVVMLRKMQILTQLQLHNFPFSLPARV